MRSSFASPIIIAIRPRDRIAVHFVPTSKVPLMEAWTPSQCVDKYLHLKHALKQQIMVMVHHKEDAAIGCAVHSLDGLQVPESL